MLKKLSLSLILAVVMIMGTLWGLATPGRAVTLDVCSVGCPFNTINGALVSISITPGPHTIRVSNEIFAEGGALPIPQIPTKITLDGGYDPTALATGYAVKTVARTRVVPALPNSAQLIKAIGTGTQTLHIRDFDISGARAPLGSGAGSGGILGSNLFQLTLENCHIHLNVGDDTVGSSFGGGVTVVNVTTALIVDSEIYSNAVTSVGSGGGVMFRDVGQAVIKRTLIYSNGAAMDGGGIEFQLVPPNPDTLFMEDSQIFANLANAGFGGGVDIVNTTPPAPIAPNIMMRTKIERNRATVGGAGIALQNSAAGPVQLDLWNVLIDNNMVTMPPPGCGAAPGSGGAIFMGATPAIPDTLIEVNSTIADNAPDGICDFTGITGLPSNISIDKGIHAANPPAGAGGTEILPVATAGAATVGDTAISQVGLGPGPNTIIAPVVASPPAGFVLPGVDYHLAPGSVAIDGTTPGISAPPDDLDRLSRPSAASGLVDMGAYETGINLSASQKQAQPNLTGAGSVVTYTVIITNSGIFSGSATMTDTLPLSTTLEPGSASASPGTVITGSGGITWTGFITTGTRVAITYAVRLGNVITGWQFINTAYILGSTGNPATGKSYFTRTATVNTLVGGSSTTIPDVYLPLIVKM